MIQIHCADAQLMKKVNAKAIGFGIRFDASGSIVSTGTLDDGYSGTVSQLSGMLLTPFYLPSDWLQYFHTPASLDRPTCVATAATLFSSTQQKGIGRTKFHGA